MNVRIVTYTAIGHPKPDIASNKYRLDVIDTRMVMTAPHAARIGSVGCGIGGGTGAATYPVHTRPSQYLTPALFHGSGNQPVGVGSIAASVGLSLTDCVVSAE